MNNLFDKEIVWITGAGSGIGEAAAKLMARQGARVLCTDINTEEVERVAAEIMEAGGAAQAMTVDVSREEDNVAAVNYCMESMGGLHMVLINAARSSARESVLICEKEALDIAIQVTLYGCFFGIKHAANAMIESGIQGRILVVGTLASLSGAQDQMAYIAAKHGALGIMKSAACDLNPLGIRVNAVIPGLVGSAGLRKGMGEHMPPGVDEPEELSETISFLLSNRSLLMTGQIVKLDHGFSEFTDVPSFLEFYQGPAFGKSR